jgi:DNA-binding LytR/AlgR family response regulator
MIAGGPMRVLIVDKEPDDRSALTNVLAKRKDIEAFDAVANISEALEKLRGEEYDVVLLNNPVPEMSEFQLLDLFKEPGLLMPALIIATTHRQAALAALEKPTSDCAFTPSLGARMEEALTPATGSTTQPRSANSLPRQRTRMANASKIAIATEGRALLIDPAEVIAVEAEGNYVLLVRSQGSHLVRGCISTLAEKLLPYGFVQIHRGILVNSSWVHGIHPRATGDYVLCTRGGKEYPVSRTYKQNLRSLAPLWIGSDVLFAE